jgi:hypothetical protein
MVADQHGLHGAVRSTTESGVSRASLSVATGQLKSEAAFELTAGDAIGESDDIAEDDIEAAAPASEKQLAKKKTTVVEPKKDGKSKDDGNIPLEKEVEIVEELADKDKSLVMWALRMNKPEGFFLFIGCMCAILEGGVWPCFSIIFSEVLAIMLSDNDPKKIRNWSLGFLGLGFCVFTILFFKFFCLTYAGEKLTARLRSYSFRALIHQPGRRNHGLVFFVFFCVFFCKFLMLMFCVRQFRGSTRQPTPRFYFFEVAQCDLFYLNFTFGRACSRRGCQRTRRPCVGSSAIVLVFSSLSSRRWFVLGRSLRQC